LTLDGPNRYGEHRMAVIALGADHAGLPLKELVKTWLGQRGHEVLDFGTHTTDSVDYPDYAALVADAVVAGSAERGILVCGTGIGMSIAANKVAGVRAAACVDAFTAQMAREHNDTNVLALGARIVGSDDALGIVRVWLETAFAGDRHARRVEKLAALERKEHRAHVPTH
jgi:ribose 5-phosphate isomerase B